MYNVLIMFQVMSQMTPYSLLSTLLLPRALTKVVHYIRNRVLFGRLHYCRSAIGLELTNWKEYPLQSMVVCAKQKIADAELKGTFHYPTLYGVHISVKTTLH